MWKAFVAGLVLTAAVGWFALDRPSHSQVADAQDYFRLYVPQVVRSSPNATATPTASATPLPTLTPTPTQPASPTATTTPAGFYIRNTNAYLSSIGTLHVVGEVVNNTGSAAQFVEITGRFYSSNGTLLDTDFTFADVSVMPAGTDSPFDLLVFDPPAGIATYQVQVTDYTSPPFDPPVTGLSATITNSFVSVIDTLHDVGTVTNGSGNTYEFVEVIIAYYDATGTVVRVDFTFADPHTLGPGESGTFEVLLLDGGTLPIASKRIWVDGDLPFD